MQVIGKKRTQQARLTIRVSKNTLSFSVVDREAEHQLIYEPYTVKSGVSIAANLRQAFGESELLQRGYQKVRVYIDTPILLVPIEEFHEEDLTVLYQHAFTGSHSDAILYRVQPNLNVVAVFPINKDLKMVIEDNFQDVRFTPIMQPMWNYLHKRSFTGIYHKLYAYFHDKKVDIFCFEKTDSSSTIPSRLIMPRMHSTSSSSYGSSWDCSRCRMSCMFRAIFRIRIGSSTMPSSMSRRPFS